jgi:hypothetical protein
VIVDDDEDVLQLQRRVGLIVVVERQRHGVEEFADIVIFGKVQRMDLVRCLSFALNWKGIDPCRSQLRVAIEEVRLVLVRFEVHMDHIGTFERELLLEKDREMEDSRVMGTLDRQEIA